MSVKVRHAEYEKYATQWRRCRDAVAGQDAVHAARTAYLPMLKDQDEQSYSSYVQRAVFFNATWRTIDGMRGMLFRISPTIEVPAAVEPLLADIDTQGTTLEQFAMDLAEEVLSVGRMGVLVDYPQVDTQNSTLADVQNNNVRPTFVKYCAESIINWRTARIRNKTVLSMVVLEEEYTTPVSEFKDSCDKQWRVLDLDAESGFAYRVRVIRIDPTTGTEYIHEGPTYPLISNKPLDYIPFYFFDSGLGSSKVQAPPLIDLVDMNLSHYRTRADYEHGCHFTGLPTPWIAGYSPEKNEKGEVTQKLYIGSTHAWVFPEANAKAGYLEFTGQGLTCLKDNMASKEQSMAVLGARMLEPQKKEVETAEAAAIHRGGEQSMLAAMALAVGKTMVEALRTLCRWAGADVPDTGDDVVFELNREFTPAGIEPQLLTALVSALQAGAISPQTMFENLQRREVISKDVTYEDEEARIEASKPTMSTQLPLFGLDPTQVLPGKKKPKPGDKQPPLRTDA